VDCLITGDFITLSQFLKKQNLVSSGGEAKILLTEGQVFVNDHMESRRGRKLRDGDSVQVGSDVFMIRTNKS
jgi:ribosome-associated protein